MLNRKRRPKRDKDVKRLRLDSQSVSDDTSPLPHSNRMSPSGQPFDNSGTSHSAADLLQTTFHESTTTTSQPIKCLTNNYQIHHPLNTTSTSTTTIVSKCAKDTLNTDSPNNDDPIKLDDLENSEIIILDSFDCRESDSDTKVIVANARQQEQRSKIVQTAM